jgi:hypothetical protein
MGGWLGWRATKDDVICKAVFIHGETPLLVIRVVDRGLHQLLPWRWPHGFANSFIRVPSMRISGFCKSRDHAAYRGRGSQRAWSTGFQHDQ